MRTFFDQTRTGFSGSLYLLILLMLGFVSSSAWSDENESSYKIQGFLSVIGGRVMGGSYEGTLGPDNYPCPCYIADWANGGVYRKTASFEPESHAGIQLDYTLNKAISFTVQVASHATGPKPEFQYAFMDYKIDGHWDLHVGRERLPLYYYSEFQDIGVSYPWISTPAEVYGWEVTNYNGASLHYKGVFGGVSTNAEVYAGDERVKNAGEVSFITYPPQHGNAHWKDIIGVAAEMSHDFWTIHTNYMTTLSTWSNYAGDNLATQRITIVGLAANLDFEDWFVVSEAGQFTRNNYLYGYTEKSPSYSVGVGMRYGAWTPLVNYAKFVDHYTYQSASAFPQIDFPNGGWGVTLRYDINTKSDFKIQYDKFQDLSNGSFFSGNAKILRASYDVVF